MKKILFVTPTLRNGGGVIRGLQNMLSLLPKDRYLINVLPLGFSDADNVSLTNCHILEDNFILTKKFKLNKRNSFLTKNTKRR